MIVFTPPSKWHLTPPTYFGQKNEKKRYFTSGWNVRFSRVRRSVVIMEARPTHAQLDVPISIVPLLPEAIVLVKETCGNRSVQRNGNVSKKLILSQTLEVKQTKK